MAMLYEFAYVYQGLSTSGRGAGARRGDWRLRVVESGDVHEDGWLDLNGLREIRVVRSVSTERHLLRPYDVLVKARAGTIQIVLVPPGVSRTVAGVTLMVVRPLKPESGMGHYLWYYLASTHGRRQMERRLTVSSTVRALSARNLAEITVPGPPSSRELELIADIVETSEEAYMATVQAARLRREELRDSIIQDISARPGSM